MLEPSSTFTCCSSIQFFNLHLFPNTLSEATNGILTLTVTYGVPCHSIGHEALPTQPLPREAEDFPRGDKYPKDVPIPTYLNYHLQPV